MTENENCNKGSLGSLEALVKKNSLTLTNCAQSLQTLDEISILDVFEENEMNIDIT